MTLFALFSLAFSGMDLRLRGAGEAWRRIEAGLLACSMVHVEEVSMGSSRALSRAVFSSNLSDISPRW